MKIGLFGGSFNPPHVCHTLATLWALQTGGLDAVWWMPTYQHAFGKELVSFEERVTMCRHATRDLNRVEISEFERELGGESRTVDTVKALSQAHPEHEWALIVGTDILAERHKWKDWEGLMQLVDLVIVGRAGHMDALDAYIHEEGLVTGKAPDVPAFALPRVSSTQVRALLAKDTHHPQLAAWMVGDVVDFIVERELYRGQAR